MKRLFMIVLLIYCQGSGFAQNPPSQAEIDKMMQQANDIIKQYGGNEKTAVAAAKPRKFPARQTKLLNSLPKKILTATEVKTFMSSLYADLQGKIPAASVKAASAIIQKLGTQYEKIAAAGVTAWYNNAPAEAALLCAYASSRSTNVNSLGNTGAVLTLCGLESKAIPVLKHVLQQLPGNSTVLNNLGQAFAGLGATDTAMYYLVACMGKAGNHPEACATAYYIELEKGNIEKAMEYAEKSLRASWDESLAENYRKNRKVGDLWKLYKDRVPKRNYFDMHDLVIPPNTKNWAQSTSLYPKQEAFIKKLEELGAVVAKATVHGAPVQSTDPADYIKWSKTLTGPKGCFAKMAQAIRNDMGDWYLQERGEASLAMMKKMNELGVKQGNASIAFEQKWGELTRGAKGEQLTRLLQQKCKERVVLDDAAFLERALVLDKFKNEWYPKDIAFYNNYVFFATLINPNENALKMDIANGQRGLLNNFRTYVALYANPKSKPDCSVYDAADENESGTPKFLDAECPIHLEIPFVVGKINLDCKKFGIEAGEGIIINYTKDFISRSSTLAIGLGAGVSIPGAGFLGGQSPFEAGVKEQFYITFDGNNQPVDGGLVWEAGAGVPGVSSTSVGYTVGVNAGWSFEPGALSGLVQ